ncbi:hypothetical protein ACI2LF_18625 [Kribbella sp. NPDC020789]
MPFSVSLHVIVPSSVQVSASVGAEPSDEYESLVIEACSALADTGRVKFHIGGFGSEEWPLDIAYDLSAFMEQFPSLLAGVRERREVEVDLYSQGIERTLFFSPNADAVIIRCQSRTDWVPNPEYETVMHDDLLLMLSALASDFVGALRAIDPQFSDAEPLRVLRGE